MLSCFEIERFLSLWPRSSKTVPGSGGIRTHASEETGALNQRLRPLGHATLLGMQRATQTLATLFWQRMLSVQVLQRTGQLPTLGDVSPIITKQAIHHVMDAE